MESEIWEQEDRDLRIKELLDNLAKKLQETPKTGKDNYIKTKLKEIINEKKVLESHLKLLQAQIEPHFLFNTLTSIESLDDTDPESAKKMQINFIQYLKTL